MSAGGIRSQHPVSRGHVRPRVRAVARRPTSAPRMCPVRPRSSNPGEASCVCCRGSRVVAFLLSAAGLLRSPASARPSSRSSCPSITVQGATLEAQPATPPKAAARAGRGGARARPASRRPRIVGGVPLDTIGNRRHGRHRRELRAPAGPHAARCPAQPARRRGQPQRRLRQHHPGAHPRRRGQPHAGADRRHRGQQHRRDGEFDFSNLSAEDIERIEVIRGPHERPLRLQCRRRRRSISSPRAARGR